MKKQPGITTGVLGRQWRATIAAWGDVIPWDGSPHLEWAIAAEDRWHFPETESSTRQTTVRGTPVTETRVRVPNGDVLQRVWSASLGNGTSAIVVEFTNDSPASVVVSLSRADVVTARSFHDVSMSDRPWPSTDRGIERPPVLIPLGHRSTVRVAVRCTGSLEAGELDSLPGWETVSSGWVRITDQASLIDVPDVVRGVATEDLLRGWRCEIALDPPVTGRAIDDVVHWLVAHRELERMGLGPVDVPETVTSLERLLRHVRKRRAVDGADGDGLRSGAFILGRHDARAFEDFTRALQRTLERIEPHNVDASDAMRSLDAVSRPRGADLSNIDPVSAVESEFAVWTGTNEVTLLPRGFAPSRLGTDFEAHRILAGPAHTVSLAIRWHGERPAIIWEVEGPSGLLLRSGADPAWSSTEPKGEFLWSAPAGQTLSG